MSNKKVKECSSCGQGFDEDNNLVGTAIPSHKCADGKHDGPIARINNISASGNILNIRCNMRCNMKIKSPT